MIRNSPQIISRTLAAILAISTTTTSVQFGHAEPAIPHGATNNQNIGQPDVNDMARQAEKLTSEGKYADAAAIWKQLIAIAEKSHGTDHPVVAFALTNLVTLLTNLGKYSAAEPFARRALVAYEKSMGPNHPDVTHALNNLALLLHKQGQYAEAEPFYRRSIAIREKVLEKDHPDVALSLSNLASLLSDQGRYAVAEPLYRRSLAIREKILGPNHPDVARILSNLASLLHDQGQYAAAESLLQRSLAIFEKTLDTDHPDITFSLNNLAQILSDQGKYTKAEPLMQRSLAIREKILGPNHPDVALSLNNLAQLLSDQGQHAAAVLLTKRSLNIYEKALGLTHPYVALSLNNLAQLLRAQKEYITAEPLLRRSLAINEKILGPDHPAVAINLNNLALLLQDQGQYTVSEPLLRRSLAIQEKARGTNHPAVAVILNNLAKLLFNQKEYSAAELPLKQSLSIVQDSLGQNNIVYAKTLNNLALLHWEQAQFGSATSSLSRSIAIETNWLIRELPLLPDQARSTQLSQLGVSWEWSFGWIDRYPPAVKMALEARLNRQGLLPEIERGQALLLATPGINRSKVSQLQALTQQLTSVSLMSERRTAIREQRDKLQTELYRQIPDLQIQLVTTAAVANALPADGVLVEFQRFQPFDSRRPNNQRWQEPQYIALVLKPDGSITSIPLGAAAPIDALVHKVLGSSAQDQSDAEANLALLSKQVLKPLVPQLKGSRQWFLSPDGELNRVPFAALPSPQQPTIPLAQAVQLRLLTTGRELVRLQQPSAPGRQALVIANPSFDRPSARSAPSSTTDASPDKARRRSSELGSSQWTPLPGSEREGQQVAGLLGTSLISGPAATTTALQRQQGPRVLHIATHGFFVANQDSPPTDPLQVVQEQTQQLQALRQEDPQLRSGLVFSGANQPDSDPSDDGYLTAAEAVTLNLKGTELVVLSACSTGQGEVRTGEGVYGLQRSLTVAGARSTLLSLWKVDDAATAAFMERFYKRLKAGEDRSNALAAVQQEFRNGTAGDGQWKEPYFWAAWQLVGDWRPIQGL